MSAARLKLLVINWQDRLNPQAGGAEVHLHEIFGRLVRRGHEVTLLCSGWPGAPRRENVDGFDVHRVGGRHTFTFLAQAYYRRCLLDGGFDLVVEDINKIPLYCPLWVRSPVVGLVPHLFGGTAFQEVSVPFAAAVWLTERPVPYFYESVPFQAISRSTADDLAERGIPRRLITVIHPGIDHSRFASFGREGRFAQPTFVYVGRLKRYKGLELVIDALARLAEEGVGARLIVAGKGDHGAELQRHAAARAPGVVDFRGYISEDEKVDLLRRAWAVVYPSPKEGWGITNIEAAACGTPAIASDSPGLRESVAHEKSGLLIPHGELEAWVDALRRVARDEALRRRLSGGAVEFASGFSWERTADQTEAHLREVHCGGSFVGPDNTKPSVSEAS
ncbi:MAG: glycosyltransferase family 4 protein [Gemmatimonadota bacterium]|nr:MAG: glycosyltransferase family 4 protein [Gemmatimonadota bacterium]